MAAPKYTKTRSKRQVESLNYVPLEPFRDVWRRRQEREGLTVGELSRQAGIDREQLARLLEGKLCRYTRTLKSGEVRTYGLEPQQRVTYAQGVRLCRALDADPWAVGV